MICYICLPIPVFKSSSRTTSQRACCSFQALRLWLHASMWSDWQSPTGGKASSESAVVGKKQFYPLQQLVSQILELGSAVLLRTLLSAEEKLDSKVKHYTTCQNAILIWNPLKIPLSVTEVSIILNTFWKAQKNIQHQNSLYSMTSEILANIAYSRAGSFTATIWRIQIRSWT